MRKANVLAEDGASGGRSGGTVGSAHLDCHAKIWTSPRTQAGTSKSVKRGRGRVGSMNKKLFSNTDMTNVSLESDYFESLGRYQSKPHFVSSMLPLHCHGCQTSPELAPNCHLPQLLELHLHRAYSKRCEILLLLKRNQRNKSLL